MIKITKCSDSRMWYSNHIGSMWCILEDCGTEYMVRDVHGFRNIILKSDCEVV